MTEWFQAAKQGDTGLLLEYLSRGADINARSDYGVTALMLAVDGRQIETIETLIRLGADLHLHDNVGWTALTRAAIQAQGWSIVQSRCLPTHPPNRQPMELLIAAGGQMGLREAVLLDDVELARHLCDQDQTIDVNSSAYFCFYDNYLMLAAQLGFLNMVHFLIARGADPESTDDLGHTALMRAAEAGHELIVAALLALGADINRGWPCETALSVAEAHGRQAVAKLLRERGGRRTGPEEPREPK